MNDYHRKNLASKAAPIAPYLGGKRNLAKRIVPLIDEHAHNLYCEPFVGMGGIFFRRKRQPRAEVINDISRDVATLFRILQRHYPQFIEMLRFQLTSRSEFERLAKTDPTTLTDLERSARFLYLQRTAFGGKVNGISFGVSPDRPARFNLSTLEPMLEAVFERLSGVTIEALDYSTIIKRYGRPGTLFYLDPPYWGCEDDYGKAVFSREDFDTLAGLLRASDSSFIMSINDVPEIRELFDWADVEDVKTTYSIAKDADGASARELIIRSA